MNTTVEIVKQVYAAFGRGDVAVILEHVAAEVDWEFVGSGRLGYAGKRRRPSEVAQFFADVAKFDAIRAFEPREFIAANDSVTVLGWEASTALDTQKEFASDWIHLFTFKAGKIVRWRGFFNTAARYGL